MFPIHVAACLTVCRWSSWLELNSNGNLFDSSISVSLSTVHSFVVEESLFLLSIALTFYVAFVVARDLKSFPFSIVLFLSYQFNGLI